MPEGKSGFTVSPSVVADTPASEEMNARVTIPLYGNTPVTPSAQPTAVSKPLNL